MELKELSKKVMNLFSISSVQDLGDALMECVNENNEAKMMQFVDAVGGDLSVDWLQKIYQYYCADREEKKQDYTPKCLAQFLSRLIGDSEETIDMCAGSGALTIQRWAENRDTEFILYEIDEKVIPYLIFNMVIRNIPAIINQTDILQNETVNAWKIRRGERFGKVTNIKSSV